MNDSERSVNVYLNSPQLGPVVFEPDGNNRPDFLVAGRIAVEARRLNENELVAGVHRGLEVTAKPFTALEGCRESAAPSGGRGPGECRQHP